MINHAWPTCSLGELFEIGAGKTMSATAREGTAKTKFLRTSNVLWDEIDLTEVDEMTIPPNELDAKLLRAGDLLVCEGGEIGRAAIWNGEVEVMSFQNHLHRLRPLSEDIEPRFYVFFLQSAFTQLGIFEGAGNKTTIPNLSRTRLAALEIPRPERHEQSGIACTLALLRNAIQVQDRGAALAQELKRVAMRSLFMRGMRGEALKETEIGVVPESWERMPISALGRVVTGNTPPTKYIANYFAGDIPFISPGDIEHGRAIQRTAKLISGAGLETTRPIPAGATCVVCIGATIGKVGYARASVSASNQQINSVIPQAAFLPQYVFYLMTYWSEHVRKQASPSPVPILSKGAFEQIEIYTSVDCGEQEEISRMLAAIDQRIDLHRCKRALLAELFESLLHKFMTGEISIGDLDLSVLASMSPQGAA